jgi:quercetin dioxygenase-like cupin family protein
MAPPARTGALVLSAMRQHPRVLLLGDLIEPLLDSSQTGGSFELLLCECQPGGGPPLHTHPQSELFFVLAGEVEFSGWIDGRWQVRRAGPGAACVIPGGAPHTFQAGADGLARFLIFATPAGLGSFFAAAGVAVPPASFKAALAAPPDFPRIAAAATQAGLELGVSVPETWSGPQGCFAPATQGQVRQVLADVLREVAGSTAPGPGFLLFDDTQLPNGGIPLHTHAQPEVFFVLEGLFEFATLDGGEPVAFTVGPGSAVYIPGGAPHSFRNALDTPSRVLVYFPESSIRGFFEEAGLPVDLQAALGLPFRPEPAEIQRVLGVAAAHGMQFMLG